MKSTNSARKECDPQTLDASLADSSRETHVNFSLSAAARRYRWFVLLLLLAAGFFNYFDRQTLSVLKTTLKAEFSMDDAGYAFVVNIFTACYAIAYIGSGWVVDRFGPRAALTAFVSLWSIATVGCGFARTLGQFAFLRGMLGFAEPGLYPVTIRVSTVWSEDKGRGVFMSLASLGSSIGTIVAVPSIVWLALHFHWRLSFVLPGAMGLAVAAAWWIFYRDPENQAMPIAAPHAAGELPAAVPLRWPQLWRQRALWGIVLSRLVSDPVWYFCLFWMPGYLQESKHISVSTLGFVGWIPFVAANVGGLLFSMLSDYRARRAGLRGRKWLVMASALLGPLCWLIPQSSSLPITLLLFCMIAVVCNAWLGSLGPIIAEVFPVGNVASVWGIAGAFGATGAIVFNYLLGHATEALGPGKLFLIMGVLHPCAAVILYCLVRERPGHSEERR
jgi:ACS family hexuronate transporter-like MFS transporter